MKNQDTNNNPNGASSSDNTTFKPGETIKVPSPGTYENLGVPVLQVPAALRPSADSTTTGTKK